MAKMAESMKLQVPNPAPLPPLPQAVLALVDEFRAGLSSILGDDLVSLFLYGSLAFPRPATWAIDVDYHIVIKKPLTENVHAALDALYAALPQHHRLAEQLDGYWITLDEARSVRPSFSQRASAIGGPFDDAWALLRAHVHAGRFFLVAGTDPREFLPVSTKEQIKEALLSELDYITKHPEAHAYCVLNSCRVLYSALTYDVVCSKYAAADWARTTVPSLDRRIIGAAERYYCQASEPGDAELLAGEAVPFAEAVKHAAKAMLCSSEF